MQHPMTPELWYIPKDMLEQQSRAAEIRKTVAAVFKLIDDPGLMYSLQWGHHTVSIRVIQHSHDAMNLIRERAVFVPVNLNDPDAVPNAARELLALAKHLQHGS